MGTERRTYTQLKRDTIGYDIMSGNLNDPGYLQSNLSKNEIFEILQNDRRRYILDILRKKGSQSLHLLSEEIACLEDETDAPKSSFVKAVYIALLQTHIPKMESLNLLAYDKENDMVKLLPAAGNLNIYIETVKKGDIPWKWFLFGLSTLAMVGSITVYFGLFKWITSTQWMFFITGIFLIASIAYYRHVRKL